MHRSSSSSGVCMCFNNSHHNTVGFPVNSKVNQSVLKLTNTKKIFQITLLNREYTDHQIDYHVVLFAKIILYSCFFFVLSEKNVRMSGVVLRSVRTLRK